MMYDRGCYVRARWHLAHSQSHSSICPFVFVTLIIVLFFLLLISRKTLKHIVHFFSKVWKKCVGSKLFQTTDFNIFNLPTGWFGPCRCWYCNTVILHSSFISHVTFDSKDSLPSQWSPSWFESTVGKFRASSHQIFLQATTTLVA